MPLNTDKERIVRQLHGFDDSVGSQSADLQTGGRAADCLMMGTVDFDAAGACKGCKKGSFGQGDMMGRNGWIEGLTVGDGKRPAGLCIDVLPDISAESQIDELNTTADGKYRFFLFVHGGKKKKLCPITECRLTAAAG